MENHVLCPWKDQYLASLGKDSHRDNDVKYFSLCPWKAAANQSRQYKLQSAYLSTMNGDLPTKVSVRFITR